jgi:Tn3 transposase DDE domain
VDVLSQMDIPWLRRPIETQLNALATELRAQWLAFDRELRQGKLKRLDYDSQTKTLTWRKLLYGAVDGQKFGVERPTVKARHSRKYFGRGKGVVAYTLLCNHVPLQGWLIGAHEYEAHHVFDIWYRNTSDIVGRNHRRHAQRQQGQLRYPALVRAALRATVH